MCDELPALVAAAIAACPAAIAFSFVAPACSAAAIACSARWAAIAASCASVCSSAALLAATSAAACYRLFSFFAFLSISFCSSCLVLGNVLCLVRCSVSNLACLPLSGSRRSRRSSISGVRGIGSLPLLPLELEAAEEDPPRSMPEVRSSLTLYAVSLFYCLRGAYLFVKYMLSETVPPRDLIGAVGGAGAPKCK